MRNKFLKLVTSYICVISLLINSLIPFLSIQVAFAEEATPSAEVTAIPSPTPTITPETTPEITPEITPSPTPEPTVTPEITSSPTPTPDLTPTPEITPEASVSAEITPEPTPTQAPSQWTFEKVELNKEYVDPQNSGVKLTFTKLPNPAGNIKIEEITLTAEQIKQTGSLSDKAYDITSDMADGSFTYNLSLPIPESSKGKEVSVKFAEELANIDSAAKVENTLTKTDTSVSVKSLDHFTIFVVVSPTPSGSACIAAGADTGTGCYSTIQLAIDNAVGGDTINVAAGTYDENVSVPTGEPLTIQGQGGTVFISATKTLTLASDITFTNFSAATSGTSIQINPGGKIQDGINFAVTGSTVNVAAGTYQESQIVGSNKGLTIQGAGASVTTIDGGNAVVADKTGTIYFTEANASIKIDGFTFINPVNNPTIGEIASIVISGGSGPSVTISNNHFIGVANNGANPFDNAIWVYYQRVGVVTNITDNEFDHQWQSILLEQPWGGAVVTGNNFHDLFAQVSGGTTYVSQGIFLMSYADAHESPIISAPVTINDNHFSAFNGYSIALAGGYPGSGMAKYTNVTIENNQITADGVGIYFRNPGTTPTEAANGGIQGATISGNTITSITPGTGSGIWLRGPNNNSSITENSITGYANGILSEEFSAGAGTSIGVDATSNWWGSASPDYGTIISGSVTYDPWWMDAAMTLSSTLISTFNTIHDNLVIAGILNNIDTCATTPNACTGLYFEKTGFGKISFSGTLDLTNQTTIDFLTGLNSKLNMNSGRIALDVSTIAAFTNKGATLEMYNIASPIDATKIIARDESNNILSGVVSGFSQTGGTVSFTAAHFTQFDIDTTPPVIAAHGTVTAEATSPSGATITYTAPNATDNIDATAPATCSFVSGSTFNIGNTTVSCNKTDTAGNTAAPTTFTVTVHDTTDPTNVTTSDYGTYTNNPHLIFTWPASSDSGSGINYYNFYLNTAASHSSPAPFINGVNIGNVTTYTLSDVQAALLSDGIIYYAKVRAVDNVGLSQSSGGNWSDGITLDTTPPVITYASRTVANSNGWNNGNVTVNWNCSDTGSGAVSASVSQTVTSEGTNQSSTGTCTDNAGNSTSDTQTGINIDKTAPTAAITYSINHAVKSGDSLVITATFSEPVVDSLIPQIAISGSNTLAATDMVKTDTIHYIYTHTVGAGNGSATVAISAGQDIAGNVVTSIPTSGATFVVDNLAPTVTKLGDNSADYVLSAGDSSLVFSEVLSDSSRTAVTDALTAGADKTLTYLWSGATLTITASETTTFANDVVVDVSDLAGNTANSLLIVDSKLDSTQVSPNGSGDVTANASTPNVVITDPNQNVTVDITSGTVDPTIDVSAFVSLVDGEQTGTLPEITINSDVADVVIPDGTVVTGPSGWDGVIDAPTEGTPAGGNAPAGFSVGSTVISIGSDAGTLVFDSPVTIVLPGVTGTVGYRPAGSDTWQTISACSGGTYDSPTPPTAPGECSINNGTDTKIVTFHFTSFGGLNTVSSGGGGGSSSGGSGDGLGCANHDCSVHLLAFVPQTQTQALGLASIFTGGVFGTTSTGVLGTSTTEATTPAQVLAASDSASVTPSSTSENKGTQAATNYWWLLFFGAGVLIVIYWFFRRKPA